jgi:hypothetical protein
VRPFVWEAVPHSTVGTAGFEHLCNASGAFEPNGGAVPWGWWYTIYTRDRSTGALIGEPELRCVPLTDPAGGPPPPPALPQPPTVGEIWDAAAIPAPQVGVNPAARGVTGLQTWIWAAEPRTEVAVSVTLDGYTVTGTARLVGYEFAFGDGPAVRTTTGGSEAQPAVRHVYETKGTYEISVATRWQGEFVMIGPGLSAPLPVDLSTAQLTDVIEYPVAEVRSVLVD